MNGLQQWLFSILMRSIPLMPDRLLCNERILRDALVAYSASTAQSPLPQDLFLSEKTSSAVFFVVRTCFSSVKRLHRQAGPAQQLHFAVISRPSPLIQFTTDSRDAPALNRFPASQVASDALLLRFVALVPMGLLPEVQKGTTVFPDRS